MGVIPRLERSTEVDRLTDVPGEIREFVRQQQSESDGQVVASNLSSLLQRAAGNSVREIDDVIDELQMLREKLLRDGARVQRELAEYAAFSQSTQQSTKVIFKSLRNEVAAAPKVSPRRPGFDRRSAPHSIKAARS